MPTSSIYNVSAVKTTVNSKQLSDLSRFLLTHRDIVLDEQSSQALLQTRGAAATALRAIYTRIIESGLRGQFTLLRIPKAVTQVPEIITYQHVPFDIKQLGDVIPHEIAALRTVPEYADKLVQNITGMLYADGTLANPAALQATVIRDALSRVYYHDPQKWLIPQLIQLICGVYSMSISAVLGQRCQLTWHDQQSIAAIFAYYYWQLCASPEDAQQAVLSRTHELNLAEPAVVADLIAVADARRNSGAPLTLDQACLAAMDLNILRLRVNRRILNEFLRFVSSDVQSSAIALEYPPYWASLMLQADAGYHIGLTNIIKKNRYALKYTEQFADLMARAASGVSMENLDDDTERKSLEGYDWGHIGRLLLGTTRDTVTGEMVHEFISRHVDRHMHQISARTHKLQELSRAWPDQLSSDMVRVRVYQATHSYQSAKEALDVCRRLVEVLKKAVNGREYLTSDMVTKLNHDISTTSKKFRLTVSKRGLIVPEYEDGLDDCPYAHHAGSSIGANLGYRSMRQIVETNTMAASLSNKIPTDIKAIGTALVAATEHVRHSSPQADNIHLLWKVTTSLMTHVVMHTAYHVADGGAHIATAISDRHLH